MSAHRLPHDWKYAPWLEPDPGNAGTFGAPSPGANGITNNGNAVFRIKTAGAETRTLPAPTRHGQQCWLEADTLVGACTITITGGILGLTTIVLNTAGDLVFLVATSIAGTVGWQIVALTGTVTGTGLPTITYAADELLIGGVKVSPYRDITNTIPLNSGMVNQHFFIADRALQIVGANFVASTAGTDAGAVSVQLEKLTGTTAPGSGTALLTNNTNAGWNAKTTANTVIPATFTATVASLQLAAGDRVGLKFSGTLTALAGVNVTLTLAPI